jgi:hypothetical protein
MFTLDPMILMLPQAGEYGEDGSIAALFEEKLKLACLILRCLSAICYAVLLAPSTGWTTALFLLII